MERTRGISSFGCLVRLYERSSKSSLIHNIWESCMSRNFQKTWSTECPQMTGLLMSSVCGFDCVVDLEHGRMLRPGSMALAEGSCSLEAVAFLLQAARRQL